MHPVILSVLFVIVSYLFRVVFKTLLVWYHSASLGSAVPGPKGLPIIGNGHQVGPLETYDVAKWLRAEADKVIAQGGNVMKFSIFNKYMFVPLDGEAVKSILDSNTEITKGSDYDFLVPWLGTGLLTSNGAKWKSRRRMLTPTFHFNILNDYVSVFDRESKNLATVLEKEVGKEIDMFPYIKNCALDIICGTAMGVRVDAVNNSDTGYVKAIHTMSELIMEWILNPITWFPPYWYLSGKNKLYRDSIKTMQDFSRNVISERQEAFRQGNYKKYGQKMAFLDMLIEANEVNHLTDEDIREEVDTFMFEGHDTTSSGIAWILWCLASHSEVQEKVYEEIRHVLGDEDEEITQDLLKEMSYTDLVIKESNRLFAPVPLIQRQLQGDFQMGEYLLPKNTSVLISPLLIQRNPRVWGNDVNEFKPERFEQDRLSERNFYDYIPFSAGPRNCIGQRFAFNEEKVMIVWILRRFRLSTKVAFDDNDMCPEVVLRPKKGIPLVLERRIPQGH